MSRIPPKCTQNILEPIYSIQFSSSKRTNANLKPMKWVGFDFPARADKYSAQKYHWYHFSGTDYNAQNNKNAIYKILGDPTKGWAKSGDVDGEKGNYDYLMFADLD